MIIELVGPPGVGKTTFMKGLMEQLNKDGITIYTRKELIDKNSFLYRNMHRILGVNADAFLGKKVNNRSKVLSEFFRNFDKSGQKYVYKMLERDRAVRRFKDRNILMDEGLFGGITSMAYDNIIDNNDQLQKVIEVIFDGEVDYRIVECTLDRQTTIERIRKRNRQDRYSDPDDNKLNQLLDVREANTKIIIDNLSKQVLTLDMGKDTCENIEILRKTFGL